MNKCRQEIADSSRAVKGYYGYVDRLGVKRMVDYAADKDGYDADVRRNEPGMGGQSFANALFIVQTPPSAAIAQRLKPLVFNSI